MDQGIIFNVKCHFGLQLLGSGSFGWSGSGFGGSGSGFGRSWSGFGRSRSLWSWNNGLGSSRRGFSSRNRRTLDKDGGSRRGLLGLRLLLLFSLLLQFQSVLFRLLLFSLQTTCFLFFVLLFLLLTRLFLLLFSRLTLHFLFFFRNASLLGTLFLSFRRSKTTTHRGGRGRRRRRRRRGRGRGRGISISISIFIASDEFTEQVRPVLLFLRFITELHSRTSTLGPFPLRRQ